MYTILCNIHDIIVYSVYIYISKHVLWPLFQAEFIYVCLRKQRRTLLCSGAQVPTYTHLRSPYFCARRVFRECLNVVLYMCTYVFCTFDELETTGRKAWTNTLLSKIRVVSPCCATHGGVLC